MAVSQYNTFLNENKVLNPGTSRDAATVDRVGARIANAIKKYYNNKGQGALLEGYKWEFNTIDSKEINAWCMPGGKVVVYTGLLPVTQNEAALAIVMGHEIAHSVAKHGNERMSQAMVQQMGGMALGGCFGPKASGNKRSLHDDLWHWERSGSYVTLVTATGNRSRSVWTYIFSHGGLRPREATAFWQRMSTAGGGSPRNF